MQIISYFCKIQKYLLFLKRAICILLSLLFCFNSVADNVLKLKTVVIDPGHGGKDPGAVSKDRKSYEKTFVLDIANRFADKIRETYPDVNVILTRSTDKTLSLDERASIANNADADLFISIHINSTSSTSPNGFSVHVLGQSSNKNRDLFAYNMDVCRKENSVVMLEDDYSTKYQDFDPSDPESFIFMQLMQSAYLEQSLRLAQIISDNLKGGPVKTGRGVWQDPFYVLWKTAMPAVLVELGFISNQQDLASLRSPEQRDKLAASLLKSFGEYKRQYDESLSFGDDTLAIAPVAVQKPAPVPALAPAPAPAPSPVPVVETATQYGTQIFAVSRKLSEKDPQFLGYEPSIVKVDNLYKYVIGVSSDLSEAKSEFQTIKKKYPSSFLVKIEDGRTSPIR